MGGLKKWYKGCLVPFLVILAIAVARSAPYSGGAEVCTVCGRTRDYYEWCGIRLWQRVAENDTSRWMDSLLKDHTIHTWGGGSGMGRSKWFSLSAVAWDTDGGVPHIVHTLKPDIGDARAEDLVSRYLEILDRDPGMASDEMNAFLRELRGLVAEHDNALSKTP